MNNLQKRNFKINEGCEIYKKGKEWNETIEIPKFLSL